LTPGNSLEIPRNSNKGTTVTRHLFAQDQIRRDNPLPTFYVTGDFEEYEARTALCLI
jgi:hypothetical protein